ncbi:hypothetical protein [Nocardioides zeae]|uniref:F0F1-type ATP synthase assembly protein I n=1 Tax=Nocardioides zeae TaxID=1457234 RepID=A0AAJ1TV76_9ACTN|nr:hypothetical protein [Nocardioides zeae]MDQ1102880.1 F0F1-type ATP synthase assembly protein I [Nocardioides zeae]
MPRAARLALHACLVVVLGLVGYFLGRSGPWGFAGFLLIIGAVVVAAIVGASKRAKSEQPDRG